MCLPDTNIHWLSPVGWCAQGYYKAAGEFAKRGIDKVAVVTMNDRFVNARWQADMEECVGIAGNVNLLSDPRGDLAEGLGLIAYLGRDLGVRAKRFALVVDDGSISHVAVDEGSDNLENTSAEAILAYLDSQSGPSFSLPSKVQLAVGGAASLFVLYTILDNL